MKNNYSKSTNIHFVLKPFAFLFSLSVLIGSNSLSAQSQLCENIVSGGGNSEGHSMIMTSDSGYIISGQTQGLGTGGYDVYIVKLDKAGNVQWTRTIGGKGDDEARSIVQTFDGGYAVAGWTNSFNAATRGYDFYVIKLDANGTVLWTRAIGKNSNDQAWSIVQTQDSGLAIAGTSSSFSSNSGMYLVRLDRNGTFMWDRSVNTGGIATSAYSLVQSPDGGYVMCGSTYTYTGNIPTSSNDFIIVKLSSNGTTLAWSRVIRDPTPYDSNTGFIGNDYARCIINTSDGGFMVVGESEQPHSSGGKDWHYLAVKLDANGGITWTQYYGGLNIPGVSIDNSDYPNTVIQTPDGGYVIGGWSFSFNYDFSRGVSTGTDLLIVKCDSSGVYEWSKVVGTDINDDGEAIVQTPDGSFAMSGYNYETGTDENIYFVKLDTTVSACCTRSIGGPRGNGGTPASAGVSAVAGGTMYLDSGTFNSGGVVFDLGVCGSIAPPPTAVFESSDTTFCSGNCITFTNLGHNATSWRWSFPGGTPATSNAENPVVCYLTAGTYDVSMKALNSNDSDSVSVSNFIQVLVTPPAPNIINRNDTLFCSSDTSYKYYQWYDSTALISGATDSFYVVSQSSNYNVQVTSSNGCNIATGINIILGTEQFTVYGLRFTVSPNPGGDELNVKCYLLTGKNTLSIFNTLGELIYTEEINSEQATVNCKLFPKGVYFVQLRGEQQNGVLRFVKE